MKLKIPIISIFAAVVFVLVTVASAHGQSVKSATWQTSVDDSQPGVVTLGLRDKWGTMRRFTATFVVTIGRKTYRGTMSAVEDEWAYIDFPSQFRGGTPSAGNYRVAFSVKGVVVGRDRFRYRR